MFTSLNKTRFQVQYTVFSYHHPIRYACNPFYCFVQLEANVRDMAVEGEPTYQFSVLSRPLIEGVSSLCRDAVGVFCQPYWPGHLQIFEVLATQAKFLEPSGYCIFTFHKINAFHCFLVFVVQFKLIKLKYLNLILLHFHLCSFQITHRMKQCTNLSVHQLPQFYQLQRVDGEVSVMLDLWGRKSTPSLPLLPGPL